MQVAQERFFLTQGGKVARFIGLASTKPDLYKMEIDGKEQLYVPSALSFIPPHKLPTIKRAQR